MIATRFKDFTAPVSYSLLAVALLLTGCRPQEQIRTYTVARSEQPQLVIERMLGAIIPNDKEAWFFKVQGPEADVTAIMDDFTNLTRSVEIKDGKVTWKVPEKWTERKGGEFRFTTLLIPRKSGKPLELAISRLDAPEGVNDKYLQANLSRWRGQLGRAPLEISDIPSETTKVDFTGGSAWMISITGMPSGSSMGAPFAGGAMAGGAMADHPPIPAATEQTPSAASDAPATAGAALEFATPTGWKPGRQSSMRKASLAAVDGESTADISVFQFPADANDLLSNVNRWRTQVGLKEVSADELARTSQKIEVDGHQGDYVELLGEKEAILGVMVKKGDSAWFFKLQAPTALAGKEKAHFEEFVKSSRLP